MTEKQYELEFKVKVHVVPTKNNTLQHIVIMIIGRIWKALKKYHVIDAVDITLVGIEELRTSVSCCGILPQKIQAGHAVEDILGGANVNNKR